MRVIAGTFRSRLLYEVPSDTTRETKDRVKESVFNSLGTHIIEAKVLDLFAGSGALGIEAISRGASEVTMVDNARAAIHTIHKNVELLDLSKLVSIHRQDSLEFIANTKNVYDIILLDPPYQMNVIEEIIQTIQNNELLSKDGIILCLHSKNVVINDDGFDIMKYKSKKIGITNVTFLKWR